MSSPEAGGGRSPGLLAGELLSGEGLERWSRAVADAGVLHDGPRATVEIRVSGGPDGPLSWHAVLEPDAAPGNGPGS